MEDGIQNKIRDLRLFGYAVWINKRFNDNIKNGEQDIAIIFGQICNKIWTTFWCIQISGMNILNT